MPFIKWILHRFAVVAFGAGATVALFLVLPLLETITKAPEADMVLQSVNTADVPPPPPPPPEEEEKEEEQEEEEPPKLDEPSEPLDLATLELALGGGTGGVGMVGDFAVRLPVGAEADKEKVDELFSVADLDQKPRAIYQPSPNLTAALRRKDGGTVYIIFVVDERGRVENPAIQSSSDPEYEAAALAAIKQWKFEPGKRNGEPVRFRMRVPITFPKSR
jgi:protein TonB